MSNHREYILVCVFLSNLSQLEISSSAVGFCGRADVPPMQYLLIVTEFTYGKLSASQA